MRHLSKHWDYSLVKAPAKMRISAAGYLPRGGATLSGVPLVFSMSGSDGVITRNDAGSFITDGHIVGSGVVVQGGLNGGKYGILVAVSASSITVSGEESIGLPFDADTTTSSSLYPIFEETGTPLLPWETVLDAGNPSASQRGPWTLTPQGWVRPPDCDSPSKMPNGSLIFVNKENSWYVLTDSIQSTWEQFPPPSGGGGSSSSFPYKQPCDAVTADPNIRRGGCRVQGVELTFANDSPDTITRSTGSWWADGFDTYSAIIVNGATNNANNKFFIVSGATATTLTVTKANGSDAGLVNETTSAAIVSPTVDGNTALWEDARVLDVDNNDPAKRGIYSVGENAQGWLRATDADSVAELPIGTLVQAQEAGTLTTWRLDSKITDLATSPQTWVPQSSELGGKLFYLEGPNNGNPNDGDAIIWNQSLGRFVASSGGGGGPFNGALLTGLQLRESQFSVNAAADITIDAAAGNLFKINATGTAIDTIANSNDWQNGSVIFLMFTGQNIQVRTNQMWTGNKANFMLAEDRDFVSWGDADTLVLQKSGSSWYEIARRQPTIGIGEAASAATLILSPNKDTFVITGTDTIDLISKTNIPDGKMVTLWFQTGGGTVTHGQSTDGGNLLISLNGAADMLWNSGDTLTLRQFVTMWIEVGRSTMPGGV